jgi:hypothetical protein
MSWQHHPQALFPVAQKVLVQEPLLIMYKQMMVQQPQQMMLLVQPEVFPVNLLITLAL